MSSAALKRYTVEEFYEFEARSPHKHQFFNGETFLLHPPDELGTAGAPANHNLIIGNTVTASHNALKGRGCRVCPSEMLMACPTDLRTYPDVTIVCGAPEYETEGELTLLNPQVNFEVLSRSTETSDRSEKFANYRSIPSLQEYVLIAQNRPIIEQFRRRQGQQQWLLTTICGMDATLELPTLDVRLPLVDLYENVTLPDHVPLLDVGRYDPAAEE